MPDGVAQARGGSNGGVDCLRQRQRSGLQPREDAASVDVFHRDKDVLVAKALRVVHPHEVAVVRIGSGGLHQETWLCEEVSIRVGV